MGKIACFFGRHEFGRGVVNESIGPRNTDPENPSGMRYPLVRTCEACGDREIYRDSQWTKKTMSGGGETVEHTPSAWLRLARSTEVIEDRGLTFGDGQDLASAGGIWRKRRRRG